jgi:hypothetical protein
MRLATFAAIACFCVGSADAQSVTSENGGVSDGVLTVRVDAEVNSLDHAIASLQRVCRCAISYEDPEWSFSGDFHVDVLASGRTTQSLKTGPLVASRPVGAAFDREDVVAVIEELIAMQGRNGNSARYQVVDGRSIEVRPVLVKNRDGREEVPELLLDRAIVLERDTASPRVWLQRIATSLQRLSGVKTIGVFHPDQELDSMKVTLAADQEPARQVIDRLLASLPRQGSWAVNYLPGTRLYSVALSFRARTQ